MIIAQQSAEMAIASYLTDPSTGGNRLMEIICEWGEYTPSLATGSE